LLVAVVVSLADVVGLLELDLLLLKGNEIGCAFDVLEDGGVGPVFD